MTVSDSNRTIVYENTFWKIERVNAGMGEWDHVISLQDEYYATAPSEEIARAIVDKMCLRSSPRNREP